MIWRRIVEKSGLPALEREHKIISTKLLSGRTVVHIYSEEDPGNGFERVAPDLEDVYFTTMAGHIGNHKPEVDTMKLWKIFRYEFAYLVQGASPPGSMWQSFSHLQL